MNLYKSNQPQQQVQHQDEVIEFPYNYNDWDLDHKIANNQSKKNEILQNFLHSQKKETQEYHQKKRQFILKHRKTQLFQQRQSMSYGQTNQAQGFKRATHPLECFQPEKPIMKFPVIELQKQQCNIQLDTVLNTFDMTKRFLKELEIPKEDLKQQRAELKNNNYRHYKGNPWTYITCQADYFGEFQIYQTDNTDKQNQNRLYNRETKTPESKHFNYPSTKPKIFSSCVMDRVNVKVPYPQIHDVGYCPNQILPQRAQTSLLKERQHVKPFTPCSTQGHYFQRDFLKQTVGTQQSEMETRASTNAKQTRGKCFIKIDAERIVSPGRSESQIRNSPGDVE